MLPDPPLALQGVVLILLALYANKCGETLVTARRNDLLAAYNKEPDKEAVLCGWRWLAILGARGIQEDEQHLLELARQDGHAAVHLHVAGKPLSMTSFWGHLNNKKVSLPLAGLVRQIAPASFPAGFTSASFAQHVVFLQVPACVHLMVPCSPAWMDKPKPTHIGRCAEMLTAWMVAHIPAVRHLIGADIAAVEVDWLHVEHEYNSDKPGDIQLSHDGRNVYMEQKGTANAAPKNVRLKIREDRDAGSYGPDYMLSVLARGPCQESCGRDAILMFAQNPQRLVELGLMSRTEPKAEPARVPGEKKKLPEVVYHYKYNWPGLE